MTVKGYQGVPVSMPNEKEHRRQIAQALNNTIAGKLNAVTSITLAPNATSTTLIDARIGANTFIQLVPRNLDALAAQVSGLYIGTKQNGQAVIQHPSSTAVDQTFDVLLIG